MPKQVIDALIRGIIRDLTTNYAVGDRYPAIKDIAVKFDVAVQTAQRAVSRLAEEGWIRAVPRSGITVLSLERNRPLAGRKIALISCNGHAGINNAYLAGARAAAEGTGVGVEIFLPPRDTDIRHIDFGHYLAGLDADGIAGFVLSDAALPLYHVLREGMDVVVDRAVPELPDIPSVALDGFRYGREAGEHFRERGFERVLVTGAIIPHEPLTGTVPERLAGFRQGYGAPDRITYCNVMAPDSGEIINVFFSSFNERCAVFSLQSGTNWLAGSKFLEYRVPVRDGNFLVHNCLAGDFELKGLPTVRAVAPSMKNQAAAVTRTLLHKWRTGTYTAPLAVLL